MKWLHLSDLHYNPPGQSYDTESILEKLREYLESHNLSVNEVFFTGDFRYAKNASSITAEQAGNELRVIAKLAGVSNDIDSHIHIVPGNHDLTRLEGIGGNKDTPTLNNARAQYVNGSFDGMMDGGSTTYKEYLWSRFEFFRDVAREINSDIWLNSDVHHVRIFDNYNIVYLNTAIACGRDDERGCLTIGYEYLHQILKNNDRTSRSIVLGHHELSSFPANERRKIIDIFKRNKVMLYLCGDAHEGDAISVEGFVQLTAGCLTNSGKIEPIFYVGEYDDSGICITAYKYDNNHLGWSLSETITEGISKKLSLQSQQVKGTKRNTVYSLLYNPFYLTTNQKEFDLSERTNESATYTKHNDDVSVEFALEHHFGASIVQNTYKGMDMLQNIFLNALETFEKTERNVIAFYGGASTSRSKLTNNIMRLLIGKTYTSFIMLNLSDENLHSPINSLLAIQKELSIPMPQFIEEISKSDKNKFNDDFACRLIDFFAIDYNTHQNRSNNKIVLFLENYDALFADNCNDDIYCQKDHWIRSLVLRLPKTLFVLSGSKRACWDVVDSNWLNKIDYLVFE